MTPFNHALLLSVALVGVGVVIIIVYRQSSYPNHSMSSRNFKFCGKVNYCPFLRHIKFSLNK